MMDDIELKPSGKSSALTLYQLNLLVKEVIALALPQSFWVIAEIAEVQQRAKGHCYLDLVERADGKTLAEMKATIWAHTYSGLARRFETATGEALKKGMKILFQGSLNFHELYGLSLNIKDIDPAYYLGELALKKREIIERLTKDGLVDLNKAIPMPLVPQNIAVISSPTAAGYGDFCAHISNNSYGYKVMVELYPAVMQGQQAEDSILNALRAVCASKARHDVAVIIRGGGSQLDLSCFDSYAIAAAVARSPLPVLTGIGHERDDSVTDLVAHARMKTPTAVAEFIIARLREFDRRILEAKRHIILLVRQQLKEEQVRVRYAAQNLTQKVTGVFHHSDSLLRSLRHKLNASAGAMLNASAGKLRLVTGLLASAAKLDLQAQHTRLQQLELAVRILDPVNILKRGYSITYHKNKVVQNAAQVQAGEIITTRLHHGVILSKVEAEHEQESIDLHFGN